MTPAKIKALMMLHGVSQAEIAEVTGKDRSRVNEVVNLRGSTFEIRKAVAESINKPLLEVFPDEQYRRPGGRIRIPSDYYLQAMQG